MYRLTLLLIAISTLYSCCKKPTENHCDSFRLLTRDGLVYVYSDELLVAAKSTSGIQDSFVYNGSRQLVEAVLFSGSSIFSSTTYTYNNQNQLQRETTTYTANIPTRVVDYTYQDSRMQKITRVQQNQTYIDSLVFNNEGNLEKLITHVYSNNMIYGIIVSHYTYTTLPNTIDNFWPYAGVDMLSQNLKETQYYTDSSNLAGDMFSTTAKYDYQTDANGNVFQIEWAQGDGFGSTVLTYECR